MKIKGFFLIIPLLELYQAKMFEDSLVTTLLILCKYVGHKRSS